MRILLVAADRMEFRGILARAADVRPERLPVHFARRAQLGPYDALLVANGAGGKRAAAAVEAAAAFAPEAIVSTGFCGALDERLGVAEIVVATAVGDIPCRSPRTEGGGRMVAHTGVICSIDHVARTAQEKGLLRKTGACAVEMEAAAVGKCAEKRHIPFYCVRAVTDLAGESLANDFNRALLSDGHFGTMFILRGALCRPTVRLPELFRLRNRCVRAAQALGDFFVGCRF